MSESLSRIPETRWQYSAHPLMAPYTRNELEALMQELESDCVERKRSAADGSGIRRNLCAFANNLAERNSPGVIFVGVEDDGRCAGLSVDDQLLRVLAGMRDDGNILPLPSITVEKNVLHGCEVAVVTVQPSRDTPVRYRGRVWVKVGPTVREASVEEEQRLTERRRARDLPFDLRDGAAESLDELDLDFVRSHYLPNAIAPDVLERNRRDLEEQLRSLRLVTGGSPTWGALLTLGRDPQRWVPGAWVQFVRVDGLSITDPIRDQKTLTGRVDDVLRKLNELFVLGISVHTTVPGTSPEVRHPDYPVAALQQLGWNAVMHRSYENSHAPARVYWYADRIEITSPGGLYGRVTAENFGQGVTDYRNPLVAEIMHHLGFGQRFGLGVPLASEALQNNGNPPAEFVFEPTQVAVILRPAA